MPKVSVIIPVYGVENYIERCARSLFEQTLDDIEYIFVDDCTPDKSIEILESIIEEYRLRFAEEKKTVRIVRMPTNSGQAAVRRHGIQLATGDYVIHCDSDDWVDTSAYEKLFNKAISESADLVLYDNYSTDGYERISRHHYMSNSKYDYLHHLLLDSASCSVCYKMAHRRLYEKIKFYPTGAMGEDLVLSSQLVLNSSKIIVLNERLYYYYVNSSSITRTRSEDKVLSNFVQLINNVELVIKVIEEAGLAKKYKNDIVVLKHVKRNNLMCLTSNIKYRKILLDTFPEINKKIIFMCHISIRDKWHFLKLLVSTSNCRNFKIF